MAMTSDDALTFLLGHQPMPSDWDITDEEAGTFSAILEYFEAHPNPRCLPLCMRSVSDDTGLGIYQHIKLVLMSHETNDVVVHLRDAFRDGTDGVKSWCCEWAADVGAWELEDEIQPLSDHPDEEIREAARNFLELKEELA